MGNLQKILHCQLKIFLPCLSLKCRKKDFCIPKVTIVFIGLLHTFLKQLHFKWILGWPLMPVEITVQIYSLLWLSVGESIYFTAWVSLGIKALVQRQYYYDECLDWLLNTVLIYMVLTGIMQKDILVNKHKYKKNNLAFFLFFFFFPQLIGPASLVAFYGSFSNCLKPAERKKN